MALTGWFTERLGLDRFRAKYLGKPFPVHPSFFLGEIALFCFVILVGTGFYLALFYEPSVETVTSQGVTGPAAYVSALLIDAHPLGTLIRRIHHWAAHLMIAAIVLHLLRVLFTAAYRRPRELNWILGLLLLAATIGTSFAGYLLPYDQFSVTATAIGYGIARSVPWVGGTLADFFFAGQFPSPSTVPRFYGYHVVFAPLLLSALIGAHLLIVFKQKHTELPESVTTRSEADERLISGIPFWPGQTVLMVELFLLLVAALAALSALLPVHPSALFGPPQPVTPEVKPDWYLMWVYGTLKMIPGGLSFRFLGATIGSEAVGALMVPGLLGLLILLVPWLDRAPASARWAEHPLRSPRRLGVGIGGVALFLVLSMAGFSGELKLSIPVLWLMAVLAPLLAGWGAYALARRATAAGQLSSTPRRIS
jgi:cytochrome b-561